MVIHILFVQRWIQSQVRNGNIEMIPVLKHSRLDGQKAAEGSLAASVSKHWAPLFIIALTLQGNWFCPYVSSTFQMRNEWVPSNTETVQ